MSALSAERVAELTGFLFEKLPTLKPLRYDADGWLIIEDWVVYEEKEIPTDPNYDAATDTWYDVMDVVEEEEAEQETEESYEELEIVEEDFWSRRQREREEHDELYYYLPGRPNEPIPRFTNEINVHVRDARVVFVGGIENPDEHYYLIDHDKAGIISVSGIIHLGFEPFDEEIMSWRCSRTENESSIYYGKTQDDCKDMWAENRDTGSAKHASVDDHLQGRPVRTIQTGKSRPITGPPLGFFEFMKAHPFLVPYRTEWSVFSGKHLVAGQIDAIFWDTDRKCFVAVDWKNVRDFKTRGYNKRGIIPEMAEYEDCHLGHYTIQLNLYRTLLETYYGIVIGYMMVVNFPAMQDHTYTRYDIPRKDMTAILAKFPTEEGRERLKLKPVTP